MGLSGRDISPKIINIEKAICFEMREAYPISKCSSNSPIYSMTCLTLQERSD